jgi:SAM-dependent methyltransferase
MESIDAALEKYARAFRVVRSSDLAERSTWMEKWFFEKQFQFYQSPWDFIRWIEWFRREDCAAHYLSEDRVAGLADASERETKRILAPLLTGDYEFRHVDEYNAVDFLLQILYPVPERMYPKRVLDFGAGYGRQMNLWSGVHNLTYVAVDAIELPYTLQSFYLSQFSLPVYEYVKGCRARVGAMPGIYHLPTWRADLLPDAFFDLVICTQVLQEIPAAMVQSAIQTFRRCMKPGGALYIRDHGLATQAMHSLDIDSVLSEKGFTLEFRPYVCDNIWARDDTNMPRDIHGVPRIFRRIDSRYPVFKPQKPQGISKRIRHAVSEADRRCGGLLHLVLNHVREAAQRP